MAEGSGATKVNVHFRTNHAETTNRIDPRSSKTKTRGEMGPETFLPQRLAPIWFDVSLLTFGGSVLAPVQQIQLSVAPVHEKNLTWFRFGELDNHIIMTTDTGQWHALERSDFERLLAGSVGEEDEIYEPLLQKGFIRNGFDVELYSGQLRQAKGFLQAGALQHRVHLSTDTAVLTIEHAKSIIDHIFTCLAFHHFAIQGPKPLDKGLIFYAPVRREEQIQRVWCSMHQTGDDGRRSGGAIVGEKHPHSGPLRWL